MSATISLSLDADALREIVREVLREEMKFAQPATPAPRMSVEEFHKLYGLAPTTQRVFVRSRFALYALICS